MKAFGYKYVFTIAFVVSLLFSGCESDDNEPSENIVLATSFQGTLVYDDDETPVSGALLTIVAFKNVLFSGDDSLETIDVMLDEGSQGSFSVTFQPNSAIDNFSFSVVLFDEDDMIIGAVGPANGMSCSPTDCENYQQGNSYEDLIISIPRLAN